MLFSSDRAHAEGSSVSIDMDSVHAERNHQMQIVEQQVPYVHVSVWLLCGCFSVQFLVPKSSQ